MLNWQLHLYTEAWAVSFFTPMAAKASVPMRSCALLVRCASPDEVILHIAGYNLFRWDML